MPSRKRMRKCCEGKRRFNTLKEAQQAAAALAAKKKRQGVPIVTFLQAYGCPCGKFHFGKSKGIDWDAVAKITANQHRT